MAENGCGTATGTGEDVIVGVEGAFTGKALNPSIDPTGLGLLLARIDSQYWPLQVCGDSGIGAPFLIEANKTGHVVTEITNIGDPIVAHACLMNCDYRITVSLVAEVIVAKIDGVWNILRVRHTSFTGAILNSNNDCRCCGFTAQRTILYARIIQVTPAGCGDYRACDEFIIDPSETCFPTANNPLGIVVGCTSDSDSVLEELDDWVVTFMGVAATIVSVNCDAAVEVCTPVSSGVSGTAPEICTCDGTGTATGTTAVTRFELNVEITIGSCTYNILIYSQPTEEEPCALTDVPIDVVEAEACGLPDLVAGNRVIMARIPNRYDPSTGTGTGTACGPVEWFIIRACTSYDCDDPCEPPPPPPTTCCGILCEDLPASLTATIEISNCDCACTASVTLTKRACTPGVESGEWRWEITGTMSAVICDNALAYYTLSTMILMCGEAQPTGTGTATDGGFALTVGGIGGLLIDNICDAGAFYFVFSFVSLPLCQSKMPGRPGEDLNCVALITITE